MFLRVDCHLSYSFANDVFFLKLEVFWLNIFNTNSIQLAPSIWYFRLIWKFCVARNWIQKWSVESPTFHSTFSSRSFQLCRNKEYFAIVKTERKYMENLRVGRSLSLPKRWQRRPIFWGQPPEQVWRQGLWSLQANLFIKFHNHQNSVRQKRGDIRQRHVALTNSSSSKSLKTNNVAPWSYMCPFSIWCM